MCNSKLKVAVCILGLFIIGCTFTHCSNEKRESSAAENNVSTEKVAAVQEAIKDLDGDGIADSKDDDIDGDGLSNKEEETLNSDPFNKDTDGDGKLDGTEAKKDTDGDSFLDILESSVKDKDQDGVVDELDSDDTTVNNDSDGDGFSNIAEKKASTDPLNAASHPTLKDTDKDGKPDKEEMGKDSDKDNKSDVVESSKLDSDQDGVVDELDADDNSTGNDSDGDGFSNIEEKNAGSNPLDKASVPEIKDTDEDGKPDKDEAGKDTDGDGKSDVVESAKIDNDSDGVVDELDADDADPRNDSDGDGASNIDEKNAGTNPLDKASVPEVKDTDEDGKPDTQEEGKDTDGDGKSDVVESSKLDRDQDGVVDEFDSDDSNPQNDSDGDGVSNIDEKNAGTNPLDKNEKPAAVQEPEKKEQSKAEIQQEINKLLEVEHIKFEVDSSTITTEGIKTIKKIYAILKKYPDIKMEIGGHTDSDGDAKYNQNLSQERVDSVKKALVEFGLDANRFTTKGYGESKPLVPNNSAENKAKNRRVEFIIIGE